MAQTKGAQIKNVSFVQKDGQVVMRDNAAGGGDEWKQREELVD